jgi:PPP family 3-phenylpropionic acid transporter
MQPGSTESSEVDAATAARPSEVDVALPFPQADAGIHAPLDTLSSSALRRGLWIARLYYFGFFAALGTISPFLNVYLQEQGLSGTQIGLVASISPLVALAAGPFWGAVADRWHAHQRVLALLAAMAGLLSLLLIWVHSFLGVMLVLALLNFFRAPISSILDGTVMGLVSRYGITYGKQRAWGSVGWIVASFVVGWIAQSISLEAIFWIHAALFGLLCTVLSLQLPVEGSRERVDYGSGVRQLIRLPGYRGLLVFMAAFGAGVASNSNFLGLHILALGGTTFLIGFANATNSIPEIPGMFWSDGLLRRFGGRPLIITGGVGFALTWVLFGIIQDPWHFPYITPLIGLFFAISWVAIVSYANDSAPPGMRASAQGISNAAMSGVGVAGGAYISGVLWDRFGGEVVFLAVGAIMAAGTIYFAWSTRPDAGV